MGYSGSLSGIDFVDKVLTVQLKQSRMEGECTLLMILTRDRLNGLCTIWRCWHMRSVGRGVLLKAGRVWAAYVR